MAVRKVERGVANVTNGNAEFIANLSAEDQETLRRAEVVIDAAISRAKNSHHVDVTLPNVILPNSVRDPLVRMYRSLGWSVMVNVNQRAHSTFITLR